MLNKTHDFAQLVIMTSASISKMHLTKSTAPTKMTAPRNEVGCGNPRSIGDKTPQSKAVFFCPSFFHSPDLGRVIHIMMGLFGQPLWLVAPMRGITTPFSPVANTVVSIGVGYPTFSIGITA